MKNFRLLIQNKPRKNWSAMLKVFSPWKSFKSPKKYLLVKYEELINKREKTFTKILEFIFFLENKNTSIDKNKCSIV